MESERTSHLTPIFFQPVGREESEWREERGKRRRVFRVRGSYFSLDFPTIGLSNPGETRGKVDPHCKSYAWVPVLWSFDKLQEVGVFSYFIYSLAKSHFNGWGYLKARIAVFSIPEIGIE